jgi:hypothetical protein
MKQYYPNKILGFVFVILFSFSCSSNLDFNQINDFKSDPVFIANFTYFDIPVNQFIANGREQDIVYDAQEFDVFRDSFFRKSLIQADFFFEINNTINRSFIVDIVLLDGNNQPLYNFNFDVPAFSGTEKLVTQTEIFENTKLDLLKRASRMIFVIRMGAGPALNTTNPGSLKLRSSATAYLLIE